MVEKIAELRDRDYYEGRLFTIGIHVVILAHVRMTPEANGEQDPGIVAVVFEDVDAEFAKDLRRVLHEAEEV